MTWAAQNFGQLIDGTGHVYDETRGLGKRPLLSPKQLTRARHGAYYLDLMLPGGAGRAFVEPIHAQDRSLVLLVGSSVSDKDGALAGVRTGLLIGGPIAVLLTAIGGYLLAGAALRPVERMRSRAAGVSADGQGERLPVPPTDDEIARLGETLNDMLARLEHARDREREFLADASHELRTPLALLKTEIELALDGRHSAEELVSSLRSAQEETDRLVQLAGDLLLLAQSDQGTLPVRVSPISASELADRIAARFAPRAAGENRRIETSAQPGLTLLVDPLRIEQALANLIDNSLRYGAGTITVQIASRGGEVELHVRDQGDGIPLALRDRAFERFARDGQAHDQHGTGLGLAIVKSIAEAHHGDVGVGHGADVFLRLPFAGPAPVSSVGVSSENHAFAGLG